MEKKRVLWIACSLVCGLDLVAGAFDQAQKDPIRLTKEGRGLVRHPTPVPYERAVLAELPKYDPASDKNWQVDLRGYDLSGLDVLNRAVDLWQADFDSATKWPARLPQGFNPGRIMDLAKNPGLGVRRLHQRGITGRGIGIAIIDQTLLVDHIEYKDRLRLYEEIGVVADSAAMHGAAVASIAVGKTAGVAPEADLYFIASAFGSRSGDTFERDFTWIAKSIDRILAVRKTSPEARNIRVISIAVGWTQREGREDKGYRELRAAVERAKKEGIFVVSSSVSQTYDGQLNFHGLGRDPQADPERVESYGPGSWWRNQFFLGNLRSDALLVPMDSRTTASPTGANDYVFYRTGGWSWSIPYIAGLYALACQVRPDITPETFWAKALETGDSVMISARRRALSPEEIEKTLQKNFLEPLAQLKARTKPEELEKKIAEGYNRMTGSKLEKMSEAEFIAWGRKMAAGDTGPLPLKTIINPGRLIEALKK